MERQTITVDIAPGNNQIQRLKSSQGDIGRPLGVYITQNGVALDCSAYTADLYILKPDGNYFTATATVDATEHNLITWETAKQETPVAGDCAAQIRILSNGDDVGTARFVEYVEASPGFVGESSESVVESLMEYVRQAAASAETASGAASSASGSASAASGSASSAASSASAAAGSASTAHTDAESASQAAQTAQDVADSIPEDYSTLSEDVTGLKSAFEQLNDNVIVDSAGPAPIVSIADGADGMPMRKVEVAIEPVQDLHGYDSPWPAGGSANKFDGSLKTGYYQRSSGNYINTNTQLCSVNPIQVFPNTEYRFVAGSYSAGTNLGSGVIYLTSDQTYISGTGINVGTFTTPENCAYILLNVGANYGVTDNHDVAINYPSTVTSYVPYSNVCPISGWTGAKVTRTGKNLLDIGNASGWEVPSGGVIAVNNDVVSIKVMAYGGTRYWRNYNLTLIGEITISQKASKNNSRIYVRLRKNDDSGWMTDNDASITGMAYNSYYGGWYSNAGASTSFVKTITIPSCLYWQYGVGFDGASLTAGDTETVSQIQIEYGSSASAYTPFVEGQTYEVTFPTEAGTVYGGTLDVVSGKLVVDRAMVAITSSTTKSAKRVNSNGVYNANYVLSTVFGIGFGDRSKTILCNSLGIYTGSNIYGYGSALTVGLASDSGSIYVMSTASISTEEGFNTWLDLIGTVQVCFYLATPVTYQLTNQQVIETLKGVNNVWSDAGNTSVTYPADTKMYIDRKITEAVANALNA